MQERQENLIGKNMCLSATGQKNELLTFGNRDTSKALSEHITS